MAPIWPDVISFDYSTRYADVLDRKSLELTVYDRNKYSANELLGSARIDLGSLAKGSAGPRKLPLKAFGKPCGSITIEVFMQATSALPGPHPPAGVTEPSYKPGINTAPPVSDRLFAGAPGLPVCWLRRVDGLSGRVLFENLTTNTVETALPTEQEDVVSVPPQATGPLGLALEPNFSGVKRHGWRSGRRNSGFDSGAVVREVRPGTFAAGDHRIKPGHHIIAINGASTLGLTFEEVTSQLKAASRPLVLRFADPYAVPQAIAAAVSSPAAPPEALAPGSTVALGGGKLKLTGVPAEVTSGAAAAGGGASAAAEAGRALELALETLAGMNAPAPSVRAATGAAPAGEVDAAVEADTGSWHKAVMDPALLRTLTAAATGVSADTLPKAARSAAGKALVTVDGRRAGAAAGGGGKRPAPPAPRPGAAGPPPPSAAAGSAPAAAAGEEDEDEDIGLAEGAQPVTSEGAAQAALRAIATLVGCDDVSLSRGDAPALTPGPRDYMYGTVLGMSDVGVLRKALDGINGRVTSPAYAGTATHVVEAIIRTYGLRAGSTNATGGGAGLDVSSLLTLQSALRKAEFQPVMTDAPPVVAALVGEFPHQDGAGFLRLVKYAADTVAGMTAATVSRARTPEGQTYYVTGDSSGWEMPPAMTVAMDALKAADKASRLLDDAAVIPAGGPTSTLLRDVVVALQGQQEDSYVASVLLSPSA